MDLLNFIIALGIPLLIGWIILDNLREAKGKFYLPEKLFIAFGLGFGFLTLAMFYFSWAKISFGMLKTISVILVLIFALLFFIKNNIQNRARKFNPGIQSAPLNKNKLQPLFVFFMVLILLNGILVISRTWLVDIDMWDSWAVWAFKAKIYFLEGRIPFEKFDKFSEVWGNWDYPHHVPLMETWILLWLGYWNDQWPRLLFPIFFFGLGICLYYFLKRNTSWQASIIGVFFVMSLNALQIYTIGTITEPVLLFYYILSFTFLLRYILEGEKIFLVLSGLFIGFSAWTKNEGMAYLLFNVLNLILFWLSRKNFIRNVGQLMKYIVIFLSIIFPWAVLKTSLNLGNILFNADHLSYNFIKHNIPHLLNAIRALLGYFVNLQYWNLSWLMFLFFLLINLKKSLRPPYFFLIFTIALHLGLILSLALLEPSDLYLMDAMVRLLIAPTILSIIYTMLLAGRL